MLPQIRQSPHHKFLNTNNLGTLIYVQLFNANLPIWVAQVRNSTSDRLTCASWILRKDGKNIGNLVE